VNWNVIGWASLLVAGLLALRMGWIATAALMFYLAGMNVAAAIIFSDLAE
jgi:hypothetical protein